MENNMGAFIFMLIQSVIFLTPVLVIFYRQGRKDQILDEVVKDVNGLGKKVSEIRTSYDDSLTVIRNKVGDIERTLIHVTTTINHISEAIKELKRG